MKIMEMIRNLITAKVAIGVFLLICVKESTQEPQELSMSDNKLCSDITKRKVKYESLLVTQGLTSYHSLQWSISAICKFEMQSSYSRGGVVAVIQKLDLRRNSTTGDCIDYIEFKAKRSSKPSPKYCGSLDARLNMNYNSPDAPESVLPEYFPVSYSNSYIVVDDDMDVTIYIAKQPLESNERTNFAILFTSYVDCSKHYNSKFLKLRKCYEDRSSLTVCIRPEYFGDGYINCPYFGCVDEEGCLLPQVNGKSSVRDRVIVGSISTLAILFAVFILIIWAFRKHKLFCWAEEFAHPSSTPENSRNSRVIEMNDQTGARLAENPSSNAPPSAPHRDEDKDLPPSYDSLFPDRVDSNK